MNAFQRYLLALNDEAKLKIVEIFNPEYRSQLTKSGKLIVPDFSPKYDWVCIYNKNKISVGIKFKIRFYGMGWKIQHFQREVEESDFEAWRFVDDRAYKSDNDNKLSEQVRELFTELNIPRPTAKELMNYYYKD